MARRYSNIIQSPRLAQAAQRYSQYIAGTLTRPSRVGTRGRRQTTKKVYVSPFTFDLAAGTVLQAFVKPADYTTLQGPINASTLASVVDTLGAKTIQTLPGFTAARLIWFRNSAYSTELKKSDITGLEYLKYNGTRSSCPFGATADTDDMHDAFGDIRGRLLEANENFALNRVSLSREKLAYR